MLDKIQEVVKQNLPEATAKEMSSFIAQAEQDKVRLSELEEKTLSQQETIEKQCKAIEELNELVSRSETLDARANALDKREQALELTLAKTKLEESEKRSDMAERLVAKVFGHPSVTVTNSRDVFTPVPVSDTGMNGYVQKDSVIESTTTTNGKD